MLYKAVLVSAAPRRESAAGVRMPLPSGLTLPVACCSGHRRAEPPVPASGLLWRPPSPRQRVCVRAPLSTRPALSLPRCVHTFTLHVGVSFY